MKRFSFILSAVLLAIFLCSCGNPKIASGKTDSVEKVIGESELYGREEIESAMQTVMALFEKQFRRCTLNELAYDETLSIAESGVRAERYNADEVIVLISSFDVDAVELDDGLTAGSTYTDWLWILTRSDGEKWMVQDWGY